MTIVPVAVVNFSVNVVIVAQISYLGHTNLITGFWSKEVSKIQQGTRFFFFLEMSISMIKLLAVQA